MAPRVSLSKKRNAKSKRSKALKPRLQAEYAPVWALRPRLIERPIDEGLAAVELRRAVMHRYWGGMNLCGDVYDVLLEAYYVARTCRAPGVGPIATDLRRMLDGLKLLSPLKAAKPRSWVQ